MELLLEVLVEPSGWDCVGRISVVVWWVMSLAVVAAAAVEKLETWWPVVCGMVVCGCGRWWWRVRMRLMLLVHADGVAHGAVSAGRRAVGIV